MSTKRYFRVKGSGDGGELAIGQTTKEFVEYWKDQKGKNESDLSIKEHLDEFDEDQVDPESPKPKPEGAYEPESWRDFDDIETFSGLSITNSLLIEEVEPAENTEFDEEGNLEWSNPEDQDSFDDPWSVIEAEEFEDWRQVYSREIHFYEDEPIQNIEDENVPIAAFFTLEEGDFWSTIIETEGEDFDINKFQVGIVETIFGEFIEQCWYDRKPLYLDDSLYGPISKGDFEFVGYLNKTSYDKWDHPDHYFGSDESETERVKEAFDELYEEYEAEKKI